MADTGADPTVVVTGADERLVEALEQAGVRVHVADDGASAAAAVQEAQAAAVVTADVAQAVATSQAVQRVAPGLPVIVAVDDAEASRALTARLSITPGISRNTRALLRSDGEGAVATAVVAAASSAMQLRRHAALVARIRDASLPPAATPETTSRYLWQLLDHAPVGIVAVDQDGTVRGVNPKACELLGRRPADAMGVRLADLFRDGAAIQRLIDLTAGTDDAAIETLVRLGPHGVDQHVEATVAAVDPEVPSLGSVVLLHDVTDRVVALQREAAAREEAEAAAGRYANMARTLQQSLLPPLPPVIPGVELVFRYHSAGDGTSVSGDFYDAFRLPDGRPCVVLGDVSGKGVAAASLTALARWTLRTAALAASSLDDLFQALNRMLLDEEQGERFCTLAAVALDIRDDATTITAATAGHPSPTIVRADGTLVEVCQPSRPVGLFDELEISEHTAVLSPGDALVMTTDGVTEARSPDGRFAPDLLQSVLGRVGGWGAFEIAASIESTVLGYERNFARDDVAVAVIAIPARAAAPVDPPLPPEPLGDEFSRSYPVDPASVSAARRDLGTWVGKLVTDDLTDTVVLLASELVTNAVRAARTHIDVEASVEDATLVLTVRDDGVGFAPRRAARRHGDGDAETGRGLLLVEALADTVRYRPERGGTTVTCELSATLRSQAG